MIKYLGSKRRHLEWIADTLKAAAPQAQSVVDVFSGTARVGHALKQRGYRVIANDHNRYAFHLARCYVEADDSRNDEALLLLDALRAATPHAGWFTRTYAESARYLHPKNAARIEGMRRALLEREAQGTDPQLVSIALTALLEAADRVDSTVGVQMAFLKSWARRAENDLELRLPALLPRPAAGACQATEADAAVGAAVDVDVAYLDPPYNQHSYLGNYHVWETLCRYDEPAVYGVAHKRVDVRERQSPFNRRRQALPALAAVVDACRAPIVLLSFSDEGFHDRESIESMLAARGRVEVVSTEAPRYVGARIGIYNPQGEKVGAVSHLKNHELLFILRR
jgi:adenine-specific DNA-methyltransferase